jgi:predicted cobalt transporter CbtA
MDWIAIVCLVLIVLAWMRLGAPEPNDEPIERDDFV